jgi:hypothetical protein
MSAMPSRFAAPSTPSPLPSAVPASPAEAARALAAANRALWLATLSLMTAFMQTQAPAHRLLLARRIARNFETLKQQECFDSGTRASFGRLQGRWLAQARQFEDKPAPIFAGLLRFLS